MAKILSIVTIALAAITAALGFLNRNTLVQTKANLVTTQAEVAATKKTLEETNGKLAESQKAASEMTTKNEDAQREITQLKTDSDAKDNEIAQLKGKEASTNLDMESLKSKIDTITKLKDEITQKLMDKEAEPIQQELNEARKQLDEKQVVADQLNATIQKADGRIKELESQIAEKKRVQKVNDLSGRILAVNEAWNFVVLSVGDKNGVSSNAELLVKRGNTRIGKVRVTSVEPASSIADIIPGSLVGGLSIQPGDYVISDYVAN
jgi:predicted RNase H-like nuclease (RuvC/YqgF family)